jgi:hypothetical protein
VVGNDWLNIAPQQALNLFDHDMMFRLGANLGKGISTP